LKHKEKRVIKKEAVEENANPFANVLKPKRPRNTEVIDPKKLEGLQKPEPVKAPIDSKKVQEKPSFGNGGKMPVEEKKVVEKLKPMPI
jgi:hypothetical protein